MRAEKAIKYLLNNAAGVTALVGSGSAARIYPGQLPQAATLPGLVVEHISGIELTTIDANSAFGLMQARIQVTAVCKTYPEVKTLLEQVRLACNYQRGVFNGVRVVSIIRDSMGPDLRDDDVQLYTQSIDFYVTYQEP